MVQNDTAFPALTVLSVTVKQLSLNILFMLRVSTFFSVAGQQGTSNIGVFFPLAVWA
jgi:hypothetical protein